jgi:hypothetical protein
MLKSIRQPAVGNGIRVTKNGHPDQISFLGGSEAPRSISGHAARDLSHAGSGAGLGCHAILQSAPPIDQQLAQPRQRPSIARIEGRRAAAGSEPPQAILLRTNRLIVAPLDFYQIITSCYHHNLLLTF